MQKQDHPLSWSALFRVAIIIGGAYLFWRLQDVIILVLLSLVLCSALYPIVKFLNKKLPLSVASVLVMLVLFLPLTAVIISVIPNLIAQFPDVTRTLNTSLQNSTIVPPWLRNIDFTQYAEQATNYIIQSSSTITDFIGTFFAVMFLALYFLIDSARFRKIFLDIVPQDEEEKLAGLIVELSRINGMYIRGNLLISLTCGVVVTVGLMILGVPYAIPLGIFAGITDLLPLVGAIIGLIPAVIIGFTISPTVGVLVIVLFLVYQQFENNILAPNIYKRALDLSPALSFLSVIVGGALFGIVGAFLALPLAASIPAVVLYISERRNKPLI